jgi:hypothetical protein
MERFAELLAKKKYADLLGLEFISGLEKRNDLLEGRFYKALAIQTPLFFMLAFSLLNVDVKVTLLGFSIDSARSLREILLVLSIPVALATAGIQLHQSSIKELLKTSIRRVAGEDPNLKAFLEVSYGLSYFTATAPGGDLNYGWFQLIVGLLVLVMLLMLIGVMIVAALTVQIASMREILLHPNFSPAISKLVVAFVVSGDVLLLLLGVLSTGIQPYRSMEDFKKWNKLAEREPEKAKQILEEIVREHMSKGWIRRTFGRPKMRRL